MAEIVNLRAARKARARVQRADAAATNRVEFGVSKAVKALGGLERERADKALDGRRLSDLPLSEATRDPLADG